MFPTKTEEKNKTHILCSVSPPQIVVFTTCGKTWYSWTGHR